MIVNQIISLLEQRNTFSPLIDKNFIGNTLPQFLSVKCDIKSDYEDILQVILSEFDSNSPENIYAISLNPVRDKDLRKIQTQLSGLSSPNKKKHGCVIIESGFVENNKFLKLTYYGNDFVLLMHKNDISSLDNYLDG